MACMRLTAAATMLLGKDDMDIKWRDVMGSEGHTHTLAGRVPRAKEDERTCAARSVAPAARVR
jgi:hypothetical protein